MEVKPKGTVEYDCVALGEVMLRFDPGDMRIRSTRFFQVFEGGGEYNVVRGLRKCFGMNTAVVTSLVENDIGRLIEDCILTGGVSTKFVQWLPFDGIGKAARNGLNFTERGFGIRNALGVPDRANTAASLLQTRDIDWNDIFINHGSRWFHTGGIFAGVSSYAPEIIVEGTKVARESNTVVSYDLNYRPSLWKHLGGKTKAQEVNRNIVKNVDVLIGNEEDFMVCLGYSIDGVDDQLSSLNLEGYQKMANQVLHDYPNIQIVATTLRTVHSASVNTWQAICVTKDGLFQSKKYHELLILDRVGGGDSFASGFIYALLEGLSIEKAVEYGAAHGALAMTTPGDFSMANLSEVIKVINGETARVVR